MKKNQSKSKVESSKSVENKCDYCRANGKCGRAMFDNYGTTCQGRSCEAWQCDAEDSSELRAKSLEGAVTVVEAPSSKLQAQSSLNFTDQDVAAGIKRQCKVIEDAEKNAQLERAKLGVILIRWEQYLGEARGGRHEGGGLKGWLEANVPELGYKAAISYKTQAEMALKMLGGGAKAQAVLLDEPTVTQPDGEVIEVEADYVAKRDKIFEDVKSRRQLEQTYFKFMASEGNGGARRGRPAGTKADLSKKPDATDALAAARAAWSKIIVPADREAVALQAAAKLLNAEDVENAKIVLDNLIEMLKERAEELKIRI